MPTQLKPLWRCPKCGERFVTKNIWHSCGKFSLTELFAKSEPKVLRLFRKFARMVRACGPVRMIPQRTRAIFQARVRFAGCYPRKSYLLCAIALPQRSKNPRFVKVTQYSEQFVGHQFRIESEDQLDSDVQQWLREAYRVGMQETLRQKKPGKRTRERYGGQSRNNVH